MKILETDRLVLRHFDTRDAEFILELINEPGWHRFIGDRGVRTLEAARDYIVNVPMAMYQRNGFGLYAVELRDDGTLVGMCGLIKREGLDDVDIGFAILERHGRKGYAHESASAVMGHARQLGLTRIVAITSVDNHASMRLLESIGMRFERMVTLPGGTEEIRMFATG
ncbi:MAG TPA: GNAT family N-acetyltransferase [Albitalea sp.]|uniref:GNAT family N-acetyltransferase n=1 Tax=Piscinibacter sp. TaxID=1903157 RepID=UPI002ED0CF6C